MSALRARAREYLAVRRALGFKLASQGPRLMSFVVFCEDDGTDRVTADLAVEWATATEGDEVNQARRPDVVRIFARHLQALDPDTEVPPDDILSRRYRRIPPCLYSPEEVSALMSAAGRLTPTIRAAGWQALTGLLAVTGMRPGEACRPGRGDAGLDAGTIAIEESKFGKSRMVFPDPTPVTSLRAYEKARDEAFPEATAFPVSSCGRPLRGAYVPRVFGPLAEAAGIQAPPGRRAPRLHDLRH